MYFYLYIRTYVCILKYVYIYKYIYIYVKYVREWFNHPEIYEWENLPFFYICVAKRKNITYICNM